MSNQYLLLESSLPFLHKKGSIELPLVRRMGIVVNINSMLLYTVIREWFKNLRW